MMATCPEGLKLIEGVNKEVDRRHAFDRMKSRRDRKQGRPPDAEIGRAHV